MFLEHGIIDFFDVVDIVGVSTGRTIGPEGGHYFCPEHGECTPVYLTIGMSGTEIAYYDEWFPSNMKMRVYCKQCLEELAVDLPKLGNHKLLSPLPPWTDELTKEDFAPWTDDLTKEDFEGSRFKWNNKLTKYDDGGGDLPA